MKKFSHPQPIILEKTTPNWNFLLNSKKINARKQAIVKIPKPKPLTINAVDMNLLGSLEETTVNLKKQKKNK